MLTSVKFAEDKVLTFLILREKCQDGATLTQILTLISRTDWSEWYCRTVHCFQNVWFNKRTHPNRHWNGGHQLSTKWALGSDQSSVRSWPCADNKVVVCVRAVCRKRLCI